MPTTRLAVAAIFAIALTIPLLAQPPGVTLQPPGGKGKAPDRTLAAIPTDSFFFVSVKVSRLWDNPAAMPFRTWVATQKAGPLDELIGLSPADVDRVTLCIPGAPGTRGFEPALVLVSTRKPYNEAKVLKALRVQQNDGQRPGNRVFKTESEFSLVAFVDEHTILYFTDEPSSDSARPNLIAQLIARKHDGPLAAAIASANEHDVALGVDVGSLGQVEELKGEKRLLPYLSLLKAKTATFTLDFEKNATGRFVLAFQDAATAKRAAPVLQEAIKMLIELVNEDRPKGDNGDRNEKIVIDWVLTLLKSAKVHAEGSQVIATSDVPYQEDVAKFVAVLPKSIDIARNNSKGSNNLKQLALAMHNYHDAMGFLPGDVGFGPPGQVPTWSWRIQLLPYVEQAQIYNKLNFMKPWDDPANLKVLESIEMPKVFEIPGRPAPKGHTYFRIFSLPSNSKATGGWPLFKEGERGPRLTSITDGTSNTFMIVEAGEAVPWYKPDLLAYDGKRPLPALGDKNADRMLVSFCDGSIRVLRPSKLKEDVIRALITMNGGEVVQLP